MRSFRFTISGLMGTVVIVSVGLAALRSGSATWASVTFLLAVGVLSLGAVGVVCGRESERAWWLGFSLFGWGYLALAFYPEFFPTRPFPLPSPPTNNLLFALWTWFVPPPSPKFVVNGRVSQRYFFSQVGHNVFSLVAAAFGGLVSHVFFGAPAPRSAPPAIAGQEDVRSPGRWKRRPAVLVLAACLLYTSVALFGARKAPGLWAGVTVLLTWGALGLTAIAAVFGRGQRRAAFFGATLFGAGYMALICGHFPEHDTWPHTVTVRFLESLRPWLPTVVREFPGKRHGNAYANARVLVALDQRISMPFDRETPLEDVLKYVRAATSEPDWPGLPIYVDPIGLQEAEKTMQSPVTLVMEGVPLRTTLHLLLRQLGMTYNVEHGLVVINAMASDTEIDNSFYEDPFLLIGQCVLAWLAAGLGGVLAPLVADRRGEQAG